MAAPLIILTIVVVLDVLYLLNFLFVRTVRKNEEREEQRRLQRKCSNQDETNDSNSSEDVSSFDITTNQIDESNKTTFENGSLHENEERDGAIPTNTWVSYAQRFAYALLYDRIYRESNQVRHFPQWNKKWMSIGSTVFLVIGSSFIMSPQLIVSDAQLSPLVQNAAPDFCESADNKMEQFQSMLLEATQVELARQQSNRLLELHAALQHDLTQFGEGNYTCPTVGTISGSKADYVANQLDRINGPFFPGYCQSALQESIELAQEEQCTEKVCAKAQRFGITWAKKCVDVISACPPQTEDVLPTAKDYFSAQMASIHNGTTASEQQVVQFAESFANDNEELYERASMMLTKIMHQVDIASTVYVFYACLSLIFPAPLILHRSPIRSMWNRFFLGVNKYQFIFVVVAFWWLFEYYDLIWFNPQLRLYAVNMLRDPCFVDSDYVLQRQSALDATCNELLLHVNNFHTYRPALHHMTMEANLFVDECCPTFPYENLGNLESPSFEEDIWTRLGFDTVPIFLEPYGQVLFPNKTNFTFLGDTTVCSDLVEAERLILATSPEATVNFWELWIASGLIASLLFKVVLANLGLALYWLADPLSRCGGTYEYPSEQTVSTRTGMELKSKTIAGLDGISLKWAIVWFVAVKLCLLNLFTAANLEGVVWDTTDPLIYAAFYTLCAGSSLAIIYIAAICSFSGGFLSCLTCGAIAPISEMANDQDELCRGEGELWIDQGEVSSHEGELLVSEEELWNGEENCPVLSEAEDGGFEIRNSTSD